ncbi:MAG: hypothetical protein KAT39_05895, partial [Alphaproteobacteria bacterium]|nr:hypothetical protein [Alphaproteobacteria bacterium]
EQSGPVDPRLGEHGPESEPPRNPKHDPEFPSAERWGCLGVLFFLLGIPLILLGIFFGLCTMNFAHPLFFLLATVCLIVGVLLIVTGKYF